MQDIQSTTEKNGPSSRAILMAMRIRGYDAKCITKYGRSRATLDATGRRHRVIGIKHQVVALWKSLSKASNQKARNGPSTWLIESSSCVERSNATMKAEELS